MRMSYILDTNVLISLHSRNFFMELGKSGLPVRWSSGIEAEFRRVWARRYPDMATRGPAMLYLMRMAVPDWRAPESHRVLKEASLPDPDDVHVLAAAVGSGASVIVTWNLRDFPPEILAGYGVVARTPDDVLRFLFDQDQDVFLAAAATMRARLKNPAMTAQEWLAGLRSARLTQLADRLADFAERL